MVHFQNVEKRIKAVASCGPLEQEGATAIKERGIVTHVAHVEVEVETSIVIAVASLGLVSSVRGGSAGSTLLRGGEFVFGRLAADSVGELVDCDCASGGVEVEPIGCV
jgi:hypothetical protein